MAEEEEITLNVLAERLAGLDRHLTQRIESLDQRIAEQFRSSSEATRKAETATESRFEGVNEFRAQLSDQTKTFVPRSEFEQLRNDQIALTSRVDSSAGVTKGGLDARSLAFLILGAGIGLFGIFSRFIF